MIEFQISQMAALVLEENVKLSKLLKSQIASAPVKADYWLLRCEKEDLVSLHQKLVKALEKNSKLQATFRSMVLEEVAQVCKQHT